MKLKNLLTICMASAAIVASAQGYKDGIEYYRADQLDNAKTLLERNLNNSDTNKAEANYYLGAIALRQNNVAAAKKHFEAGIAADAQFGLNYVGLGELELLNKNVKAAESQFKLAEKYSKKEDAAAIRAAIARSYFTVDPVAYEAKINKYIADAQKKDIQEPDIYLLLGDIAAAKQDWGEAGSMYEMAINYHPDTAEGYVKYAKLYDQVNPSFSIAKLKELVAAMPQSALGQRELALMYYEQAMFDKAAEQYGKYVKNPNHFKEDEDQYALLLFFNGEYQKGYDFATQQLAQDPNNFTAQRFQFMNAAQIPAMSEKVLPMADALVAKRSDKNMLSAIDYTLIGSYYASAGRVDDAKKIIAEAMNRFPDNPSFSKSMAEIYVEEDNYPAAADAFNKFIAATKSPKYSELIQQAMYNYIAGVDQLSKGATDVSQFFNPAVEAANRSIEMFPDQYRGYKILGDIKVQQRESPAEQYAAAAERLVAMEKPNLNDAKAVFGSLIKSNIAAGDMDAASKYLNMYLKMDPADAPGFSALF